ncbi:MAG: hypothetical protein HOP11_11945 [Saprospiraceae bacterium]|nr:hypothetical protein [Saprospiraceae bacterium]
MNKEEKKIDWSPLWYCFAVSCFFLINDYFIKYGFSWSFDSISNILRNINNIIFYALIPGLFTLLIRYLYINTKNFRRVYQEFVVPFFMAVFTLILGTYGFLRLPAPKFSFGDAVFGAANLLTLNSSIFKLSLAETQLSDINLHLYNARVIGGFFLAYAFFLALILAMGRENKDRISFWFYRLLAKIWNKEFVVVIGDGRKASNLAYDLYVQKIKVVLLDQCDSEEIKKDLEDKKVYYLTGNATARNGLKNTYFQEASKVYIFNESEEENFRTTQEMIEMTEEICYKYSSNSKYWYAGIQDINKRNLLMSLKDNLPNHVLECFDLNQNIARSLVFRNDEKAIGDTNITKYQVIMLGFNDISEAIIMQYLKLGHFRIGKSMQIKVYYQKVDAERVEQFKSRYAILFPGFITDQTDTLLKEAISYTFFNANDKENQLIDFESLPEIESTFIDPNFSLYNLLMDDSKSAYLYACLKSGLQSATMLSLILPCLNTRNKTKYLKVFCHYNYLDPKEETMIETRLNKLTNYSIQVKCFGSDLLHCTCNEIENKGRDLLSKYYAFLYSELYNDKYSAKYSDQINAANEAKEKKDLVTYIRLTKEVKNDIYTDVMNEFSSWAIEKLESRWLLENESDREANRNAADHSEIKLALYKKNIPKEKEGLKIFWKEEEIMELAEIEHRRWNAEKLLLGWLPNKEKVKTQRLHNFLRDFENIDEVEKDKDYTQIKGLPYFLNRIKN